MQTMLKRQLYSFLLPFTATLVVPAVLLWIFPPDPVGFAVLRFILGMLLIATGFVLLVTSIGLFLVVGQGTLAPWDPPQTLVIKGVYQHTRNPMLSGVNSILLGQSILLGSLALLAWTVFFFVLNTAYFILSEEPALQKRFGASYLIYKKHVPRWFPRLTPWQPP